MKPVGKYYWLIKLLYENGSLTFKEINEEWLEFLDKIESDDRKNPFNKRTFVNHINAIRDEYGINIKCGPGYRYYISDPVKEVLAVINCLSALEVLNETISDRKLNESLFANEFFDFFRDDSVMTIMDAIKRKRKVKFSHFKDVNHPENNKYIVLNVAPYQLHYICSKWYVIGKTDEFGLMRIPLRYNRSHVRLTDASFQYPVNYSSDEYSKLIYGGTYKRKHLSIKITSPISQHVFDEDYFEKYPIMPFQQGVELKKWPKDTPLSKYRPDYYIIVHLDLPPTPFAFYVLRKRMKSYTLSMIDDQVPFDLFSEEQYNDDVENPVVL